MSLQQTCISNMLGQAQALGCPSPTDVVCLCSNADFTNGVIDCANQACADAGNADTVISFGRQYCASGECCCGLHSFCNPLIMTSRRERQRWWIWLCCFWNRYGYHCWWLWWCCWWTDPILDSDPPHDHHYWRHPDYKHARPINNLHIRNWCRWISSL